MINMYFRRRLEAILISAYPALAVKDNLLTSLKTNVAVYKSLNVDANWTVTASLCEDHITSETDHLLNYVGPWTLEITARHKTKPDWFVTLIMQSIKSNSNGYVPDTSPRVDICNSETHTDYEEMRAFVDKLALSLSTLSFDDATVLFSKNA